MAFTFRVSQNGAGTIDFNATLDGYRRPDVQRVSSLTAIGGNVYRYRWGVPRQRHEISMNNVSWSVANNLNLWWSLNYRLHFTPDLVNYPAATISVRIVNEERPFDMFNYAWRTLYSGTIIFQEVPSGS